MAIELVTYNLKTKFKNIRNVIKNILIPKYKEEKHIKLDKETLELARDALENIPIRRDIEKAIYIEFDEIMRDCL